MYAPEEFEERDFQIDERRRVLYAFLNSEFAYDDEVFLGWRGENHPNDRLPLSVIRNKP